MQQNLKTLIDKAEQLFKPTGNRSVITPDSITTTKLRSILSLVQDIYHEVLQSSDSRLAPEIIDRIQQMRIRIVYECGRDPSVKYFIQQSEILQKIGQVGNDRESYLNLCHYIEALVAYHRFYGGKDSKK